MRGGFVACINGNGRDLDRIVESVRWHRGKPFRDHRDGLDIAACVDSVEGPFVETRDGRTLLVHGAAPESLEELQRRAHRFAAIEWDGRRLRATRDPIGLAPLFYRHVRGAIWLATEVEALEALGSLVPDPEALTAQAAFVPLDDRTGWQGIARVLAGSTLEIDPGGRSVSTGYWTPGVLIGRYQGGRAEAVAELRERLRNAVTRCYERGAGILLSGGLDSAVVAAVAAREGPDRPRLVHVHFPDIPLTHEQRYAGAVAEGIGVPLHVVPGEITPWDIGRELRGWGGIPYSWLPYGMEEPALADLAARGVSVALDGHDGDGVLGPSGCLWGALILGGEWRHLASLARDHGLGRVLRGAAVDFLPPYGWLRRLAGRPPLRTYLQQVADYFAPELAARVLAADIDRWRWPPRRWRIRQMRPLVPGATISFEQKELEAARHGIDMRHPFADRELVEFLISLPPLVKSDPVRAKALLVDAFADVIPHVLRQRPKSDYMAVVRRRVDPGRCVEVIRDSGVRLAGLRYERLFADVRSGPERVPLFFLVNLARVHAFAAQTLTSGIIG
jgi:asparagine synthase (glutamine-hydrolysing)